MCVFLGIQHLIYQIIEKVCIPIEKRPNHGLGRINGITSGHFSLRNTAKFNVILNNLDH